MVLPKSKALALFTRKQLTDQDRGPVELKDVGDSKPQPTAEQTQHDADALASAIALQRVIASGKSDVFCAPHTPLNLAAVAAIYAGLDIDEGELRTEVLVAKA